MLSASYITRTRTLHSRARARAREHSEASAHSGPRGQRPRDQEWHPGGGTQQQGEPIGRALLRPQERDGGGSKAKCSGQWGVNAEVAVPVPSSDQREQERQAPLHLHLLRICVWISTIYQYVRSL